MATWLIGHVRTQSSIVMISRQTRRPLWSSKKTLPQLWGMVVTWRAWSSFLSSIEIESRHSRACRSISLARFCNLARTFLTSFGIKPFSFWSLFSLTRSAFACCLSHSHNCNSNCCDFCLDCKSFIRCICFFRVGPYCSLQNGHLGSALFVL